MSRAGTSVPSRISSLILAFVVGSSGYRIELVHAGSAMPARGSPGWSEVAHFVPAAKRGDRHAENSGGLTDALLHPDRLFVFE